MPLTEKMEAWLVEREIDPEVVAGYGWETLERDASKLSIPYIRNGQVVNHKFCDLRSYRNPAINKWTQDKGGEKCFYNYDCLTDPSLQGEPIVITEGEFDWAMPIQVGFPRSISVPDGAPNQSLGEDYQGLKYTYLDDETIRILRSAPAIILATDADRNGRNLARDIANRVGRPRCKYVTYPSMLDSAQPCKDLNKVATELGLDVVKRALEQAKWWRTPALLRMSEYPPSPDVDAYACGDPGIDDVFKIGIPSLAIWTGIPGHGKTTFLGHVLNSAILVHGWRVCFCSFEQPTTTAHRAELRRWYLQMDPAEADDASLGRADEWIDRHFVFALNPEEARFDAQGSDAEAVPDLTWVLDMIEAAALRYECKVVVVDPWNEMEHTKPPDMTLTEYVGLAIREIRRAAFRFGVHVAIVAHPTKLKEGDEASLYSISDSAHWANKPDQGCTVHRPDPESTLARFRVRKRRFRSCGKIGTAEFLYDEVTGRFLRKEAT